MYIEEKDLDSFLNNIAKLLGDKCEIVVHDFTNGLDHTVVKIINGHISNREIGACPSSLFFEKYKDKKDIAGDLPTYFNRDKNGRLFKSSSTFLHDKDGMTTGAVCINLEVTKLVEGQQYMNELLGYGCAGERTAPEENKEVFYNNVSELMDYYLTKVKEKTGKEPEDMNKKEKIKALAYLEDKGILQIAKAHVRLCEFFHISTYTLYAYLDEIRKGGK